MKKRRIATYLVLLGISLPPFISVVIGELYGFVVSVQKLVALCFIPAGIILYNKIYISRPLVVTYVTLLVAYNISNIGTMNVGAMFASTATLTLGLFSAVAITSVVKSNNDIRLFTKIWVVLSCIVSILCIFQVLGMVPSPIYGLENSTSGALLTRRAYGLKQDPNFTALMLCMGFGFSLLLKSKLSWSLSWLIVAGVLATQSGMGMVLVVITFLVFVVNNSNGYKYILILSAVIGSIAALYVTGVAPRKVGDNIQAEFVSVMRYPNLVYDALSHNNMHQLSMMATHNSVSNRAALAVGGMRIIRENFLFGVGSSNIQNEMQQTIGDPQSTHNTFLDLLAIGGVFGMGAIVFYSLTLYKSLNMTRKYSYEHSFLRFLLVFTLFSFIGISVVNNFFMWLPISLSICVTRR